MLSETENTRQVYRLVAVVIALISTGCSTTPKYPDKLTASAFKTIRLDERISTPSVLYVPSPDIGQSSMMTTTYSPIVGENGALVCGGIGAGIGGTVQNAKMDEFTADVRKDIDSQKFTEETVRSAFIAALEKQSRWELIFSNDPRPADATFTLAVLRIGADGPVSFFPIRYQPTVTIAATLTGPAPLLQNGQTSVKPSYAILYQRIESNRRNKTSDESGNFVKAAGFSGLPKYTGDVELFKKAITEAVDLAVKQLADSWQ